MKPRGLFGGYRNGFMTRMFAASGIAHNRQCEGQVGYVERYIGEKILGAMVIDGRKSSFRRKWGAVLALQ